MSRITVLALALCVCAVLAQDPNGGEVPRPSLPNGGRGSASVVRGTAQRAAATEGVTDNSSGDSNSASSGGSDGGSDGSSSNGGEDSVQTSGGTETNSNGQTAGTRTGAFTGTLSAGGQGSVQPSGPRSPLGFPPGLNPAGQLPTRTVQGSLPPQQPNRGGPPGSGPLGRVSPPLGPPPPFGPPPPLGPPPPVNPTGRFPPGFGSQIPPGPLPPPGPVAPAFPNSFGPNPSLIANPQLTGAQPNPSIFPRAGGAGGAAVPNPSILPHAGVAGAAAVPNVGGGAVPNANARPSVSASKSLNPDDVIVREMAMQGLEKVEAPESNFRRTLVKVVKAQEVISDSTIYYLEVVAGETNCSKEKPPSRSCDLNENGIFLQCRVLIEKSIDSEKVSSQGCWEVPRDQAITGTKWARRNPAAASSASSPTATSGGSGASATSKTSTTTETTVTTTAAAPDE